MEEVIVFWKEVDNFENASAKESKLVLQQEIKEKYLEKHAESEVNLDVKEKNKMCVEIETATKVVDFTGLKKEAEAVMQSLMPEFHIYLMRPGKLSQSSFEMSSESFSSEPIERNAHQQKLCVSLLLEPDNELVLYTLIHLHIVKAYADEEFLPSITELLLQAGCLTNFLKFAQRKEIALCTDANTLFRENGVFVSVFGDVLTRSKCKAWLAKEVLKDCVKLAKKTDSPLKVAQNVLDKLKKKASVCPFELRYILSTVSHSAAKQFPEMRWMALGSFVFLRWIGPALANPLSSGMCKADPPKQVKSCLLSTLRLLLCKVNGTKFSSTNADEKEMQAMASFVDPANSFEIESCLMSLIAPIDEEVVSTAQDKKAIALLGASRQRVPDAIVVSDEEDSESSYHTSSSSLHRDSSGNVSLHRGSSGNVIEDRIRSKELRRDSSGSTTSEEVRKRLILPLDEGAISRGRKGSLTPLKTSPRSLKEEGAYIPRRRNSTLGGSMTRARSRTVEFFRKPTSPKKEDSKEEELWKVGKQSKLSDPGVGLTDLQIAARNTLKIGNINEDQLKELRHIVVSAIMAVKSELISAVGEHLTSSLQFQLLESVLQTLEADD